ncbi:MAG: hypothetical protein HKM93_15360 [Desulfobacteraceae bacterium]|nr:hypothetical protein [Desulfobacteraceae bacterium]
MKTEIIRVGKQHRPLKAARVLRELQREFPEYEAIPLTPQNQSLVIRESRFAGARVDIHAKAFGLKGKVPDPMARILDLALFGTISAVKTPNVVNQLKRFLKTRYAG